MKIRTDFVTNSSSSSFILAFTDKDKIAEELAANWPTEYPLELGRAFADTLEAEPLSKKELLDIIKESCEWDIEYNLAQQYQNDHNCSYREARDYMQSPIGQEMVKKEITKILNKVRRKLKDKNYFVDISYSDHEYYELEQEIMPHAAPTVYVINQH